MAQTAKEKRDAKLKGAPSAIAELNKSSIIRPDAVADAHGKIAKPQVAGAKVIVGCKLGVSYYDIQLCRIDEKFEQNMQGGRTVKEATRIGSVVRLRGTAYPRGTPPKGFPPPPEIIDGAAITRGVDKDWFDQWMEQHRLDPIVMNRMVFAHATEDGVRGIAHDLVAVRSGLEPIDPAGGDPRISKSSRAEVSEIQPGQRPS